MYDFENVRVEKFMTADIVGRQEGTWFIVENQGPRGSLCAAQRVGVTVARGLKLEDCFKTDPERPGAIEVAEGVVLGFKFKSGLHTTVSGPVEMLERVPPEQIGTLD